MAIVVNHRIAQDTIEPGNDFLVLNALAVFQAADERGLQDVFGGRSRFDPAFQEGEEVAVAADQARNCFRGKRLGRFCLSGHYHRIANPLELSLSPHALLPFGSPQKKLVFDCKVFVGYPSAPLKAHEALKT